MKEEELIWIKESAKRLGGDTVHAFTPEWLMESMTSLLQSKDKDESLSIKTRLIAKLVATVACHQYAPDDIQRDIIRSQSLKLAGLEAKHEREIAELHAAYERQITKLNDDLAKGEELWQIKMRLSGLLRRFSFLISGK